MNIFRDKIVIEAVKEDLWSLETYSNKDVTIIILDDKTEYIGNKDFIYSDKVEISNFVRTENRKYKNYLMNMAQVFRLLILEIAGSYILHFRSHHMDIQ